LQDSIFLKGVNEAKNAGYRFSIYVDANVNPVAIKLIS
jgi:hypothetical protein